MNPRNVSRTIESILEELNKMRENPVTEAELRDVKGFLKGVMPLRIESNEKFASMLHKIEYFNLGEDFLNEYFNLVDKVGTNEIKEVARRYFRVSQYALVVAGPYKE